MLEIIKQKTKEYFPGVSVEIYKKMIIVDQCIDFTVHDDYIYIDMIENTKYSGSVILDKIDKIAKSFSNFKYIELEDVAGIVIYDSNNNKFEYFLSTLYIMSTGMSWYNKHEYYFETFQEDYSNLIEQNFITSFQYIKDNLSDLLDDNINFLTKNLKIFEQLFDGDLILNCINYILSSPFINSEMTIKNVGDNIRYQRNDIDDIIYLKVMILTFMNITFKYKSILMKIL